MNKDNQLEQQLDRLGERIASQPSILDAVMQRVETMEAPSRPARRLGRIVMKATMAMAASVLVGIAIWLGITSGTASRAYGMQDFERRLQAARSYHLKGWLYHQTGRHDGVQEVVKVPMEAYVAWPCTYYHTQMGDNNGVIGTGYRAEDAERYICVDNLRKKCETGRNYPFATELFVADALEEMPRTLMREGSIAYRKVRSERIDGAATDVYEATMPSSPGRQYRQVVWLNPTTGMPVRMASYMARQGQPEQLREQYDLVEVDVPPPAGLFTFEPPTGYEVTKADRGPESAALGGSASFDEEQHISRFEYNIDDKAMLICWAWYNPATTPPVEPDPANPPGQSTRLIVTGVAAERAFQLVPLRTDPGYWRWSLLIPEDGQPIGDNPPCMIFKGKKGKSTLSTGPRHNLSRETLADFVVRSQRVTLPADAPADAALTLEQIEAKIAELTRQP